MEQPPQTESARPAGYAWLIQQYGLAVMPTWHQSAVAAGKTHRVERANELIREVFPASHWPGDALGDHLEFALKYDGVNLQILTALFAAVQPGDIAGYIGSTPTGRNARRIWYLYEFLTGQRLPLDDLRQGNYIDLLDPAAYYVAAAGRSIQRQRIRDNLLGDARFCPIIRRTDNLSSSEESGLAERCQQVLTSYPPELLRRALGYLYTKETRSSFEIEHITPTASRTERFVAMLQTAEHEDFFNKAALIELQNRTVDDRFRDPDYRRSQNYVGETVAWQRERIHFVAPRPEDLEALMDGMFEAHRRMADSGVHPVIHAATVAFGFVFMHLFEDGNGRIHRFLIHNILARRGFTPRGIMFPVSAAMLRNRDAYDAALEAFSRPLMQLVEYSLDDAGRLTVHNPTQSLYRFIDMTAQTEALFRFIEDTIQTELVQELEFLLNYDRTKQAIQQILDMPDRLIDLFIRCCLQNHGRLSNRKRADHFKELGDDEVQRMEAVVQREYRTEQNA